MTRTKLTASGKKAGKRRERRHLSRPLPSLPLELTKASSLPTQKLSKKVAVKTVKLKAFVMFSATFTRPKCIKYLLTRVYKSSNIVGQHFSVGRSATRHLTSLKAIHVTALLESPLNVPILYTYQLCESKTLISRQITPAD